MTAVLVTRRLPEPALAPLAGYELRLPSGENGFTAAELLDAAPGVEAILCVLSDQITAAVIAAAPRLRVVGNIAVGYDNIDVAAAEAAGVVVVNTPGILDEATADLAFMLILAAARGCGDAERDLRAGGWTGWSLNGYLGRDVHGATLGLVGYGRIARAVARRASGFDMTVLHHTRTDTGMPGYVPDLDELLTRADIISVHVPYTAATHHLIGARELALLGPEAVLVNTARGAVVDEAALAAALHENRLFGAGLDVYANEPSVHPGLLSAPRTVLLPHIGSATARTRMRMARVAAEGVAAVLANRAHDATRVTAVDPPAGSRRESPAKLTDDQEPREAR
ncbi:D-glycerate dehydrogenase [Dactylosporangium sp. NPDC000555]|uniref:2-hydroxyacid dehydrogenase n=1 Tax=Dactylosporangium sp. NPDC000555 TaxID=3154260 RepID=UPI00332E7179